MTLLFEVAETSAEIGALSSRVAKRRRLVALLKSADRGDIRAIVAWLSGELLQRRIGVGWAGLSDVFEASAATPSLAVAEVDEAFSAMATASGPGSQALRTNLVHEVFSKATDVEQAFLRALLAGGLRQGALAGVMTDAVAHAAAVDLEVLRRAVMLRGELPAVAEIALTSGPSALATIGLEVGRGVAPMLAESARSVADALSKLEGAVAFEAKLDGARIQVHRRGEEIRLFTRSLDDVTARLPSVVRDAQSWPVSSAVLDGEILALAGGVPLAFQETSSRFARKPSNDDAADGSSLRVFFFDVLHLEGRDLFDEPAHQRRAALETIVPAAECVPRLVTRDAAVAQDFFERMVRTGYEGVVAKAEGAPYEAGRRRATWLKVKPILTLDLVVLAVEWGSGRRQGKLSNIHLGARDPDKGGFVMLGKTFKGMTDAMLDWQTARFRELAVSAEALEPGRHVVRLRPEQVVEIALDGVQASSRYPGKMALRFARVLRYRDDKTAAEADTLDAVRAIHRRETDANR
ncbi:MAG: ATP-dependent DNA ligase [Polyangiaceae bacterium]